MNADRAEKFNLHSWGERFVAVESASGCDHCPEKGRCFVCAVEIAKKAFEAGVEASAARVEEIARATPGVRSGALTMAAKQIRLLEKGRGE